MKTLSFPTNAVFFLIFTLLVPQLLQTGLALYIKSQDSTSQDTNTKTNVETGDAPTAKYSANNPNFVDNIDEQGPFYGGDMVISDEQLEEAKTGIIGSQYRWPKGQIPYVLDNALQGNERSVIQAAMNEIQSKTCIRFNQRTINESAYISIVRGGPNSGCFSSVGKQTEQPQKVNYQAGNPGCFVKGVVAHELIHAIGYFHEQSRSDRDDYVTVYWQNIKPASSFNFDKYSSTLVSSYGVPYDFGSIMHYSSGAFSANGQPTLKPKDNTPLNVLGQRNGLSARDAQKINAMYKDIC